MNAYLDHVGIAVADLPAALAFFRDAFGLAVEASEAVASQHVRATFVAAGGPKLELLESTSPDSAIARFIAKRGPGLHHVALRVDDIRAALAHLKSRGVKLIDEQPRDGAEGAQVAFIHPSSAHGVLVELKAIPPAAAGGPDAVREPGDTLARFTIGDLELTPLSDGFLRLDGGAMFGIIPRPLWERQAPADARNRIRLAMRPLLVRGEQTMIIDAGVGDKESAKFADLYGLERERHLDDSLAAAGLSAEDVDVVLATHLHFDHAGGFTARTEDGRLVPRIGLPPPRQDLLAAAFGKAKGWFRT